MSKKPYGTFAAVTTIETFFRWFPCCKECLVRPRCLVLVCINDLDHMYNIGVSRPCEEFYTLDKTYKVPTKVGHLSGGE